MLVQLCNLILYSVLYLTSLIGLQVNVKSCSLIFLQIHMFCSNLNFVMVELWPFQINIHTSSGSNFRLVLLFHPSAQLSLLLSQVKSTQALIEFQRENNLNIAVRRNVLIAIVICGEFLHILFNGSKLRV